MKNIYEPTPVGNINFLTLSNDEMLKYKDWLVSQIPERVRQIEILVKSDPKYSDWVADRSPESLAVLGQWMVDSLQIRPRTIEEIEYIKSTLIFDVEIQKWDFTDFSYSIILDVALYFSTIFTTSFSNIRWGINRLKRGMYYGKPVLEGFIKKMDLSLPDVVEVCAMKMVRHEDQAAMGLLEVFRIYESYVPDGTPASE